MPLNSGNEEKFVMMMNRLNALHQDLHSKNIEHRIVDVIALTKGVGAETEDERLVLAMLVGMNYQVSKFLGVPF